MNIKKLTATLLACSVPAACLASGHLAMGIGGYIYDLLIYPFIAVSAIVNVLLFVHIKWLNRIQNGVRVVAILVDLLWLIVSLFSIESLRDYFREYKHWYIENLPPHRAQSMMAEHDKAEKAMLLYVLISCVAIICITYTIWLGKRQKNVITEHISTQS